MKNFLLILLYFINNVLVLSAQGTPGKWGDQGNETYINPILNADYSDPDVIRVRDKYYMIASDFHFSRNASNGIFRYDQLETDFPNLSPF